MILTLSIDGHSRSFALELLQARMAANIRESSRKHPFGVKPSPPFSELPASPSVALTEEGQSR
jgi:hypothetical protein